jgi:hypothetical protein
VFGIAVGEGIYVCAWRNRGIAARVNPERNRSLLLGEVMEEGKAVARREEARPLERRGREESDEVTFPIAAIA